ncbi:flagellar basal body L-ring protein FlgH [Fodinibius salsisoli]|uniref:Flagellar basal body L-ring protein FlgH n=1 Tax=Fodinibius salsisoli TaxID=2820877 RepID=A0ABT3PHH1_9BACT|nr:flagellar basal body L-ring protein FlgH [Fodinibius salsisoli]MCW9705355.1 flagellar basal body L-ring protein FlgH [Fodinibius salsisoli]
MEKYTLIGTYTVALLLVAGITSTTYAQRSLYKDNKAMQVGDVLTVILQENISGSTSADAQNSSNAGSGAGGSVGGNFMPFKPTFGADAEVNYESDEQVSTNQGQLLEGYMSVEVTDRSPSGNLIVEGSRTTEINGEKHQIELSGTVRPNDINGRNEVFSFRLANAQINYEKEGGIKGVTKKEGFLKRAILTVAGLGLSAVAVLKAMK